MVQVLEDFSPQSQRFGAFSRLSKSLGGGAEALKGHLDERQTRQTLADKFGKEFSNIRDPRVQQLMLQSALNKEEQAEKSRGEYAVDEENYEIIKDAFNKKFADVWRASPTGARTALIQAALEARARGIDLDQMLGQIPAQSQDQMPDESMEITPEQEVMEQLHEIIEKQDEGLVPEEKFKRSEKRFETGFKEYKEASTKLQGLTRDKERLSILENLNKSNKLPKNLGRLNVDKEGNLRLPFLGTNEAQRYVKTLNEFSAGAKDTFGSRVTNFDLAQYLKRYPTLLNTKEGRRQLLDQMKLVNQINSVYYKNLKKVYDEAGGARAIDADRAEALAEKMSENKVNELASKFLEIGQFSSKPNPTEFKGRKIVDEKTGEVFVSDGNEWVPTGQ